MASPLLKSLYKSNDGSPLADQRLIFPNLMYNRPVRHTNIFAGVINNHSKLSNLSEDCSYINVYSPENGWNIPNHYKDLSEIFQKTMSYEATVNPSYEDYYVYLTVNTSPIISMKSQQSDKWSILLFQSYQYQEDAGRSYMVVDSYGPLYIPIDESIPSNITFDNIHVSRSTINECGNSLARTGEVYCMDPYQLYCFDQTYLIKDRINYYKDNIQRKLVRITISKNKLNIPNLTTN